MLDRDTKFAQFKIAALQYLIVAMFFILATGFWRLQISQPLYYKELADQNRIKSLPLLAPRGRIVDREGRVIAGNYPSFSVLLLRDQARQERDMDRIAEGLDLDPGELRARLRRFRSAPKYEPLILKEDASLRDLAYVEAHRDEIPGLEVVMVSRRLYPRDGFLAHLLGYVGEVSEGELDLPEFAGLRSGQMVGKTGIERQYNDLLIGQDGLRRVIVDSRGREVGKLDEQPSTEGTPLRLTIDLDLQVAAEQALEGKQGAIVALDPRNGEVLAMVSRPAFDPNKFAVRINRRDWQSYMADPHHPLLNRAIQAQLAPGSTFKLIMTVAGLETDTITPQWGVNCPGGANFYGRFFKCHTAGGHGHVELHRAIVQSCDVFFYTVGQKLGIDNIAAYAGHLGLGRKTGIDLPHEEEGVVPSPKWKLRMFREKWYAGETISVAIGQGSVQTTPLQLAYLYGGVASEGNFRRPHVVFPKEVAAYRPGQELDQLTRFPLKSTTVAEATSGLFGVVNEGGTGGRARVVGLDIGGKTGTAQVASLDFVKAKRGSAGIDLRDNAWFIGISPHRHPEIAVAVLFEHGELSTYAAGIAREVIRAHWDKKNRGRGREVVAGGTPAPVPAPPGPGGQP